MIAAVAKAERDVGKASARLSVTLSAPDTDGVWSDEEFWQRRWPAMCDRLAAAVEDASAVRAKHARH